MDAKVESERLNEAFQQGFAEGMADLRNVQLYHVQVFQGETLLVEKDETAEAVSDLVRQYLIDIGGSDLAITISSVSSSAGEVEGETDDDVVDAEVVEE